MMQAMQDEIRNLRQGAPASGAPPARAAPVASGSIATPASGPVARVGAALANNGTFEMPILFSAISSMQWMGMELDTFEGRAERDMDVW
jgi:hypothetical protein